MCKRAPIFLRAVINRNNRIDCLDMTEDTPSATEKVHVYEREGESSWIHIKGTKKSISGFYAMADYHHLPDVDGELLRDNEVWQKWTTERFASDEAGRLANLRDVGHHD